MLGMIFQDANQTTTYWCFGEPKPFYTATAGRYDYWTYWVAAPLTA
uniref:Uncharacterized protein n=1 Tax=viral metagenome TaxID=1070528 RepID=A0A6M3KNA2_9ZZZZ